MEEAFSKVTAYEQRNIPAELKIQAWERFVQAFSKDNPYTSRDEELRTTAQDKICYWKERGIPIRTPAPPPSTPPPTPKPSQKIPLRSEPLKVSDGDAQQVFGLDEERRPREYIENNFEDLGDVVIDHATGLMWQKSGSDTTVTYQKAQAYIEDLNRQRFAGYDTWRLPTIPELMSLIESEEHSNGLYLNPIFDDTQRWCWSADTCSSGSAWHVSFRSGHVNWNDLFDNEGYVRGVRSIKHKKESIRTKEKPGQHQKAQKQTPEQQNEKIGLDSEIMKRLMSDEHSIVMASYANIPNEEKDLYSDALIRKLSSASTQDRLMALTALFAIYRKKSFSSLTRMVDDTSSAVRRRAVFYLGEIRALKSLPLITERLSDKDRNVRAAARTAYKKITGRDASPGHFS